MNMRSKARLEKSKAHVAWNHETKRVNDWLVACVDAEQSPAERRWLWELARNVRPGGVWVEIGTKYGGSSRIVGTANPKMQVYTVDTHNDKEWRKHGRKRQSGYVKQLDGVNNVLPLTGVSSKMVPALAQLQGRARAEFDVVFIDGDHSYEGVVADIEAYMPYVRDGGMLCGHDYYREGDVYFGEFHGGMRRGVDEALARFGYRPFIYERIWYVIVQK